MSRSSKTTPGLVANLPAQTVGKIDGAGVTEGANPTSILGVQCVEPAARREEDPAIAGTVGPVDHATVDVGGAARAREWIEAPDNGAAIGAERDDRQSWGSRVEHTADHNRRRLNLRLVSGGHVTGVIHPRHPKLRDIVAGDLVERRISGVARVAAGDGPVRVRQRPARARREVHYGSRGENPREGRPEMVKQPPFHRANRMLCHHTARLSSPSAAN
jgi:hypothetical protein